MVGRAKIKIPPPVINECLQPGYGIYQFWILVLFGIEVYSRKLQGLLSSESPVVFNIDLVALY